MGSHNMLPEHEPEQFDADGSRHPEHRATWRPSPPVVAREDCTVCQGTGWQLVETASNAAARRCSCTALLRVLKLKDQVQVPQRYEHCTFASFSPMTLSQTRAANEAMRFAERFPSCSRGLLLTGPGGAGKTHLAVAILRDLVERLHEDLLFADFQSVLLAGLDARSRSVDPHSVWQRARDVGLLVLDDLGLDEVWPRSMDLIEELFRARVRRRKLTIYTADLGGRGLLRKCGPAAGSAPEAPRRAHPRHGRVGWLCELTPRFVARWLGTVRQVRVDGPDFRKREGANSGFF